MNYKLGVLAIVSMVSHIVQAQFTLQKYVNKDTCIYSVQNMGADTFLTKKASMLVFSQKNTLLIEPGNSTFGVEQIQYQGRFYGKSYKFNYKTVQNHPLTDTLFPGKNVLLVKIVNTSNATDTIMGARIAMQAQKLGSIAVANYPLYPTGATACAFLPVYTSSGTANNGIGHVSFSGPQNDANECLNGIVVKCFDQITGIQKGHSQIIPACSAGKQHTTYGGSTDLLMYHSYSVGNNASMLQLDSFINLMNTGDYFAVYTKGPFRLNGLSNYTALFSKIGISDPMLDTTTGYTVMVGRKGAASGKGKLNYCQSSHLNCRTNLEYTISLGNSNTEMYDYPECYETLFQPLTKFTNSNITSIKSAAPIVYPNPTNGDWTIKSSTVPVLYDVNGKQIKTVIVRMLGNEIIISSSNLSSGIYYAKFADNQAIKLVKN